MNSWTVAAVLAAVAGWGAALVGWAAAVDQHKQRENLEAAVALAWDSDLPVTVEAAFQDPPESYDEGDDRGRRR